MNKRIIDNEIKYAYEALKKCKIAKNGFINKTYRGQISSFGAAITTGSLLSAVCFFSDNAGATTERKNLLKAIVYILGKEEEVKEVKEIDETEICKNGNKILYDYIAAKGADMDKWKEDILNAAIALKLAMNLYTFEKETTKDGK